MFPLPGRQVQRLSPVDRLVELPGTHRYRNNKISDDGSIFFWLCGKTPKKKEILSFTYKNHWYRVLLSRIARPIVDSTVHGAQEQYRER